MKTFITLMLIISASQIFADTASQSPSEQLLNIANIRNIEITDRVVVKIEKCENPVQVPIKALARVKNVSFIKAAIETSQKKKQKLLFSLKDEGGLSSWNGYVSVRLDISEYNPGTSNIWVFFNTGEHTYANAAQIKCNVINN